MLNFPNKKALPEGVIENCLGKPFVDVTTGSVSGRREVLRQWLTKYISADHRDNPTRGCVLPTLGADVARANPAARAIYGLKMEDLVGKIAAIVNGPEAERERRARSIVAITVGSIGIARAMPDGQAAVRALDQSLDTAISLIG